MKLTHKVYVVIIYGNSGLERTAVHPKYGTCTYSLIVGHSTSLVSRIKKLKTKKNVEHPANFAG